MLLWHAGATLWLFRWIFRDPKVDVRFLLFGALLPDLVDLMVGTIILPERFSTGEIYFHSLLVPTLYTAVVLLTTRRGRRRRAFMAVGVGWLFHLLLDGLWIDPEVLFWPFFGWDITAGEMPFWPSAWQRALGDPWRWVLDAVGLGYLIWLWFATGLTDRERRVTLYRTGRIPDLVAEDA
ncbi:MAG TPA: metal-dependent hydrolase [Acidimicrobiia bacterium]|nr:metal-dependent hydrolase [Acidimicrobiia bacterium]